MALENSWKLLAGLGIFLYGMILMEGSLKELAGRAFKLFLKKYTNNVFSAILIGTIVTGFLQSSSVVTFMVLAFVGAGIISMNNAIALIMGSNLGTTLSNWLVVLLGFKLNIESFTLPIIALAVAGLLVFNNNRKAYQVSLLFLGFAFLFWGLNYMKVGMEVAMIDFDFTPYLQYPKLVFVILGLLLTVIIQSSSATVAITLSALNAGIIPFTIGVSVVIGSELGTSLKSIFGAMGGISEKKRVAMGNIIFNLMISSLAFILMSPIIYLITSVIEIKDHLIALVCFQSIINLGGIVLFLPFIKPFGKFLEKSFQRKTIFSTRYITKVNSKVTEAELEALEKETAFFIQRAISLNMEAFHIKASPLIFDFLAAEQEGNHKLITYVDRYNHIKKSEGEILAFYSKIRGEKMTTAEFNRLNRLIASVRNAMYSAKAMKDVMQDRKEFRESANDQKYKLYKNIQFQLIEFYNKLNAIHKISDKSDRFFSLKNLLEEVRANYNGLLNDMYSHIDKSTLKESDISTFLNVNRELYASCKAIIFSLRDYLLDESQVEEFENLPISV